MNEQGTPEGALWDRVTRRLFRNLGSGAFVLGPDTRVATFNRIDQVSAAAFYYTDSLISDKVDLSTMAYYLPLSGGSVDHLSVGGGLSVGGLLDTEYVKTDGDGKITITGKGATRRGGVDMQFEGGINSISINGASLSSYIRE